MAWRSRTLPLTGVTIFEGKAFDHVTGEVTIAAPVDVDVATSHSVTVQASSTDGSSVTRTFDVSVSGIPDVVPPDGPEIPAPDELAAPIGLPDIPVVEVEDEAESEPAPAAATATDPGAGADGAPGGMDVVQAFAFVLDTTRADADGGARTPATPVPAGEPQLRCRRQQQSERK